MLMLLPTQIQDILKQSLAEMELLHRKQELEQAELEWAVAISLALEEERLRLMYADAKDVDAAAEDAADTKVRSTGAAVTSLACCLLLDDIIRGWDSFRV